MRQVLGAGALGRPRGIGWRGKCEGGSGWGIHINPWLIHVNVWKKPLQYCKLISLQLIKINWKKKDTKSTNNKGKKKKKPADVTISNLKASAEHRKQLNEKQSTGWEKIFANHI